MFIVECQKNQAKVRQTEPITSGSQNVYVVQFKLSEEWDPLTATAVFMAGNRIINMLLDDDRECMVPWEVMQYAGEQVMVGVFGTMNGNVVLPTVWASMGNLQQGVTTGIYPSEPTPSVYQQIVNQLNHLKLQIENGIPYAIDGIVDMAIVSVDGLSGMQLPRQVIMLNSSFKAEDGKSLSFNNGIVHLEYVDYLDTENEQTFAIRVTDYDGNVYDVVYNNYILGGPFTTIRQVRDGDIRNDYELARSEGFTGTLAEWLESLKGKDGNDALCYLDGVINVDDSVDIASDTNIKPNSAFNRTPVVGDVLMIPATQSDVTYFIIWKATSVSTQETTLTPQSVTRVSPIDGKDGVDGRAPIYYIGETIFLETDESDSFMADRSILNAKFTRTPFDGDVVTIPLKTSDASALVTYFVKQIGEDYTLWQAVNALNTTGSVGETGPQALWGNFELDTKPIVGGNIELVILTGYSTFNRSPKQGDQFSGVAVSTNQENNPFVCYISGEVIAITEAAITNVTLSVNSVTDIGGSSFTPDFITSQDIANLSTLGTPMDRADAVAGFEAIQALLDSDTKVISTTAMGVEASWTEDDTNGYSWTYIPDIPGNHSTLLILVFISGVTTFGSFTGHTTGVQTDMTSGFVEKYVTFYGSNVPTENFNITVVYRDVHDMSKAGIYPIVSFSNNQVVPPEFGGTGETGLPNSTKALINSLPACSEHAFTDMKVPFSDSVIGNVEYATMLQMFQWLTGRTDGNVITAAGTDYETLRTRAISLGTTMPTTGLVNGALYGIYT